MSQLKKPDRTERQADRTFGLNGEAKFGSCEPMLQKVRMIKTPAEIELLCRAATATERALMATYSTARPGEKERDLVARLGANILQSGAELPSFLFFTVGPNSGYAHPDPTDIELQPNDILKADCGGCWAGDPRTELRCCRPALACLNRGRGP